MNPVACNFSRISVPAWEDLLQELIFIAASIYTILIHNNLESSIFNCHNLKRINYSVGRTLVLAIFLIKNLDMESKMHLILFAIVVMILNLLTSLIFILHSRRYSNKIITLMYSIRDVNVNILKQNEKLLVQDQYIVSHAWPVHIPKCEASISPASFHGQLLDLVPWELVLF